MFAQQISQARFQPTYEPAMQKTIMMSGDSRYAKLIQNSNNKSLPLCKRQMYMNKYHAHEQNFSMVHFYFKELGIIKYSRDELYGITDLIGM